MNHIEELYTIEILHISAKQLGQALIQMVYSNYSFILLPVGINLLRTIYINSIL